MLRIPAHSHIIKPSYGYMGTTYIYIYISLYVDGGAAVPSGWKNKIFVIWILSVAWAAFFLEINTLH
jgi:hypothetical protein